MKKSKFLRRKAINNYQKIIDIIVRDENVEHLGAIHYLLDRHDKKRNNDDPELKKAIFTIVRDLLHHPSIQPSFMGSFVNGVKENPLQTEEEILNYLDTYWDEYDEIGRAYLLFFKRV